MATFTVNIESVDYEGNGVARIDGKTVFIAGAISGEEVTGEIFKRKARYDRARLISIIKPSPLRVKPPCPNFGVCGGCSVQHIEFSHQVAIKQQVLVDNLERIAKVTADTLLPPLMGQPWAYRDRARLTCLVTGSGKALVGFKERATNRVTAMQECLVLPAHVSLLIGPLGELIGSLSIAKRIPQVEVAVGTRVTVLLLRILDQLSEVDGELLKTFIEHHSTSAHPLQLWLQSRGPESAYPFYPQQAPQFSYELTIDRSLSTLKMPFYPGEFTQVNSQINQDMVNLALELLQIRAEDTVADFFCGIGNFTLAIALNAQTVLGVEGLAALVNRAKDNAQLNGLSAKVEYQVADLFAINQESLAQLGRFDKWLIDPPRDGALALVNALSPELAPQRIVYISCNPATLARDAAILVHQYGYRLIKAGVINMFPHTAHIEACAVFELE